MTTDRTSIGPVTELPQGTITFLFTDIQGSTQLLQRLGDDYGQVLSTHRQLLREAFSRHRGREVDTQGDAFFVAFMSAKAALAAAIDAQRALDAHPWPKGESVLVRMGIHTGEPLVVDGHYVGIDVHRAARIASCAHGGQVVASGTTHRLFESTAYTDVGFKDLGVHHLKDLEHPERILQVVAEGLIVDFPPVKSVRPPTNVPHHAAGLIGRRAEKEGLRALLLDDDVRLVTVTGPGGIGKTRLAAATALDVLDDFSAGVFFVDLTLVQGTEAIATHLTGALQVSLDGGRAAIEALIRHIGEKKMLLLLDNFEHLLEGADVVAALLQGCSDLKILITSRAILSLGNENEFLLDPLGLPRSRNLPEVAQSDAVQLFVKRARAARPGFELDDRNASAVAEICEVVDGLPLAIELAAARIKLFSAAALLRRLDERLKLLTGGAGDAPIRHRALRTTIDWSYDLLSADERAFFRHLAVFRGGATLEALEQVIGGDFTDVLDPLTALVNHSLIKQREDTEGEIRFRMLHVVREYAAELLETDAEGTGLRERHARYYLSVAEGTNTKDGVGSAPPIDADHDNMQAALGHWLSQAEAGSRDPGLLALRLATALGHYSYRHGHAVAGEVWLEKALAAALDPPDDLRANALRLLGVVLEQQRKLDRATEVLEQALVRFRSAGDRAGEAACLNSLGVAARARGELRAAQELHSKSLSLRREIGDDTAASSILNNLAIDSLDLGDLDRAESLLEETMTLDRARGDEWGVACTAVNLGFLHLERRDVARARSFLDEARLAFVELGDLDGAAETLEGLVGVAVAESRPERAARLAGGADALRKRSGLPLASIDKARLEGWLEKPRQELGRQRFEVAWREGGLMTLNQVLDYAGERLRDLESPGPS